MDKVSETGLLERIRNLSGREFETFVASLWELQGWTTEITDARRDGGRDIIAERNLPFELKLKIEAKGWASDAISGPRVRQYALLPGDDADHAVVVTSSSFTDPAKRTATRHDVKLVDSSALVQLVQTLDAEALLTDAYEVADWEQITSVKHLDWTVETPEEVEAVDVIPGIGESRAEQLADVGIDTVEDLLVASPHTLAGQTPFAESRLQRWSNLAVFYRGGERVAVLDGIGQSEVEQLSEADIYTVDDLRDACPKEIARQTDIREYTLKKWVGEAVERETTSVTELPRIGNERTKKLAKAGIFTVSDLAAAESEAVASQADIGIAFLRTLIREARNEEC